MLAALALFFLLAWQPVQAAKIDGWLLHQRLRIGGSVDLFLSKSALRLVLTKSGLVFVASAPWQEAYIYCKATGRIYRTSFSKLSSPYVGSMALFDGNILSQLKVVSRGKGETAGITCKLFSELPGEDKRLIALYKRGEITGRTPAKLKYLVTDQLKLAPQIATAISRFYALPDTGYVPLEFSFLNVADEKGEELSTSSCKAVKLNPADFTPPPGLKAVTDSRLVLVPDQSDEENGIDLMMMGRTHTK